MRSYQDGELALLRLEAFNYSFVNLTFLFHQEVQLSPV